MRQKDIALVLENLNYYSGEGFWNTAILPKIDEITDSDRKVMARVKRLFQVSNKCREVVVRHRNALYGNAPTWYIVNQAGERDSSSVGKNLGETLRRLQAQWLRMSIGRYTWHTDPVAKAIDDALITGYGYLRIWSPAKYANSPNLLQRVGLHSPNPDSVNLVLDDDGFIDRIEYFFLKDEKNYIEVQELDEQGYTVFRWEDEDGKTVPMDDSGTEEIKLNLGGRFSIFEIQRAPLITETVKRSQNGINHALTMVPTNIEFAGFLSHIVLNGLPPGEYQDFDGRDVFIPKEELIASPGRTAFVSGIPQFDETGRVTGYTTPSIASNDPVDITSLVNSYKLFCSVIYENCNQGHILGQDMIVSGISRQQMRADFKTALSLDKIMIEAILADCWMAALLMLMQGQAKILSNYDIAVNILLDLGAPSPEERKDIRDNYAAGLLSKPTAISLQGYVDNAETEVANIEKDAIANVEAGKGAADILDLSEHQPKGENQENAA
ncbi:hypothetical protein HW132_01890 [Brasilonema sp. CT11]|nr:hypothetical protein [Brasilonema sp. CT11]